MLSATELAYMREVQEGAMPDTCTLRTITATADGSGGWAEGTSDTTSVPCRLVMSSGAESQVSGRVTAERIYTLTIPRTYTLTPTMRVIKSGATYEVVAVNESASWQTALRATLVRRES